MIHKKTSAGGFETTTADSSFAPGIITSCARLKAVVVRFAAMLATVLRGRA